MTVEVKHAVILQRHDGTRILLPPYRFENDAKLACARLLEIGEIERAMTSEKFLETNSR